MNQPCPPIQPSCTGYSCLLCLGSSSIKFRSCLKDCPNSYPWLHNTNGTDPCSNEDTLC